MHNVLFQDMSLTLCKDPSQARKSWQDIISVSVGRTMIGHYYVFDISVYKTKKS